MSILMTLPPHVQPRIDVVAGDFPFLSNHPPVTVKRPLRSSLMEYAELHVLMASKSPARKSLRQTSCNEAEDLTIVSSRVPLIGVSLLPPEYIDGSSDHCFARSLMNRLMHNFDVSPSLLLLGNDFIYPVGHRFHSFKKLAFVDLVAAQCNGAGSELHVGILQRLFHF
jgi:hypothetical protein